MSLSEQVGQLLMVAQSSTRGSTSGRKVISDLQVGSVPCRATARQAGRTRPACRPAPHGRGPTDGVGLLVAVDQEGGLVQRLQGSGFTRIPTARKQAALSDSTCGRRPRLVEELGSRGRRQPRSRRGRGPVELGSANKPIGALKRGYGSNPGTVARKTAAVVEGMHAGGTATAAKHFPGLGSVKGNTDGSRRSTTRRRPVTTRSWPGSGPRSSTAPTW